MPHDWDVIVVGSGAGGATLAYACARAGKRVLLLERGRRPDTQPVLDEQQTLIEKAPYDDRPIEVNGGLRRLYMGGVVGGGTSLYGAALLRPSRDDFHPGRHYGRRIPRSIWDWPIAYEDMAPHYAEAERLYGVAGEAAEDFGPLEKPRAGFPGAPLPLHPLNRRLMDANRARGLRPFRLPLAIDASRCLRCGACAGFVCPTGARRSGGHLLERGLADGLPLRVLTGAEAERLSWNGAGMADGVRVVSRATGERSVHTARRYVLSAGAIGSPLLLLRSGVDGPLVGRNYMMHMSPIVTGLFVRRTGAATAFIKQVGFADFYHGTPGHRDKTGLVQSLPAPGPLLTAKMAPRFLPRRLLTLLVGHVLPLAGIVEDLPNPANRVSWNAAGRPRLDHGFDAHDLERGRRLAQEMARILRCAGALVCLSRAFPSEEHVAHQCGTLRFGRDARDAVLDPDCRLFGHPNVFVVDGSFFPTSLGVGPALTIIANALRVAQRLIAEL